VTHYSSRHSLPLFVRASTSTPPSLPRDRPRPRPNPSRILPARTRSLAANPEAPPPVLLGCSPPHPAMPAVVAAAAAACAASGGALLLCLLLTCRPRPATATEDGRGRGRAEDDETSPLLSGSGAAAARGRGAGGDSEDDGPWPHREPVTCCEAAAVAARTARRAWGLTVGRWGLHGLAFGIKRHMKRQVTRGFPSPFRSVAPCFNLYPIRVWSYRRVVPSAFLCAGSVLLSLCFRLSIGPKRDFINQRISKTG
jgi:hypothetical protein